jgi:hypothetical protein
MNKLSLLTSAIALAAAATGLSSVPTNAQQVRKPNVLMIMTDDVGWGSAPRSWELDLGSVTSSSTSLPKALLEFA